MQKKMNWTSKHTKTPSRSFHLNKEKITEMKMKLGFLCNSRRQMTQRLDFSGASKRDRALVCLSLRITELFKEVSAARE